MRRDLWTAIIRSGLNQLNTSPLLHATGRVIQRLSQATSQSIESWLVSSEAFQPYKKKKSKWLCGLLQVNVMPKGESGSSFKSHALRMASGLSVPADKQHPLTRYCHSGTASAVYSGHKEMLTNKTLLLWLYFAIPCTIKILKQYCFLCAGLQRTPLWIWDCIA